MAIKVIPPQYRIKNLSSTLSLIFCSSVVDPNPDTDPYPAFQVNPDPDTDPGF